MLVLDERWIIRKWRTTYISDPNKCWKINEEANVIRKKGNPGGLFWEWNLRTETQHEERFSHKRADWMKRSNKYRGLRVRELYFWRTEGQARVAGIKDPLGEYSQMSSERLAQPDSWGHCRPCEYCHFAECFTCMVSLGKTITLI